MVHVLTSGQANEQSCPHDGFHSRLRVSAPPLACPVQTDEPLDRTEVPADWPLDAPPTLWL